MRLLKVNPDGRFGLAIFLDKEAPPYAILSHTWEGVEDEVTFDNLVNGPVSTRKAFRNCNSAAIKHEYTVYTISG